jgi:hypothetical protein
VLGEAVIEHMRMSMVTKANYLDRIALLLGGIAAERVVFGEHGSGAGGQEGSDLVVATDIATTIESGLGLVDMPEAERNAFSGSVYNRIKQINQITSELNKQVMGLLVLNSFIPDDPGASSSDGGVDVGREARKSVSKILSQQLNNLAGSLIKGVDINFDLQNNEDYSTGTAKESTSLNVGVSKNLFSDRLTVAVGSNIYLEGDQPAGNTSSLVGDVSIEYKLTRDGRYRIRVYQRNTNETVVQGQVVETGAAFMIVMDYDQFREILGKSKKEARVEKKRQKRLAKKP